MRRVYKQSKMILSPVNLGTAFVAIASKMVGSTYRIQDAYNPRLQQTAVSPQPDIVVKRESISLAMTWVFALFISQFTHSLRSKFNIGTLAAQLIAIVFSNTLSEGVSRYLSYRSLNKNYQTPTFAKPANWFNASGVSASISVRGL